MTTNEELRESAEIVHSWMVTPNEVNAHRNMPDKVFYACFKLAKHYLSTVRDDDGEPADLAWWAGFCNGKGKIEVSNGSETFTIEMVGPERSRALYITDTCLEEIILATNPARGQVRKIIEALGGR